jgi:hypothetical protein
MGSLESHGGKTLEKMFVINSLVEIIALDDARLKVFIFEEKLCDLLLH